MGEKRRWVRRAIAAALIVFGIIFGGTWSRTGFCLGDEIFCVLGLPAWSNGAQGTHYPAVAGGVLLLIGAGLLNSTLSRKARMWGWAAAILLLILINLGTAHW